MSFDVSLARGQFPSLKKDIILMDNGGGTQAPFQVADAMRNYMLENNVQLSGTYETAKKAASAVHAGRVMAAAFLGVDPQEIIFGANMSTLLRNLAVSLSELWDPEDEIIVCQGEHEANFGCWEYLEQFGLKLRVWEIDPDSMTFDVSALVDLINDKTRLIAVHQSGNVLGNVLPLEEVSRLTRGSNIYLCVDGGQYVPHRLPDLSVFEPDFYVFSGYKVFGPHIGVMYGKAEVLKAIPGWNHFYVDNDQIPGKFELGTGNYAGAAGLAGLEKYFRALGLNFQDPLREVMVKVFEGIRQHEAALTENLLAFLQNYPRVHVIGDARFVEDRIPVVSMAIDDADPQEIVNTLAEKGIGVRSGHFNSPRLLDALELLEYQGVVRISMAHYNTKDELERVKKALKPLIQ